MSDHTNPNPYNRPMAKFTGDGKLEVRASALGRCRRALWYSATEQPISNPTSPESLTIMVSGNALEPVVVRAMQRAGWAIQPEDRDAPTSVSVELGDTLLVSGHPDATGFLPKTPSEIMAIDEFRDVVIATLDTGSRRWDYEVIPAKRVERAWNRAGNRLAELADHFEMNGRNPEALPDRDFEATDWQCRSCPYLDTCQPPVSEVTPAESSTDTPNEPVSDEEAQSALWHYEEIAELIKSLNADKRESLDTLECWLGTKGVGKAQLDGRDKTRTVGMVSTKRYKVDHKRLNSLLDPEHRAEIVTESRSEYIRVS